MSGANARFALPNDERAPADQRPREPELALTSPVIAEATSIAPGDAVHHTERPGTVLPSRPLGTPPPSAVILDISVIGRSLGELVGIYAELACPSISAV